MSELRVPLSMMSLRPIVPILCLVNVLVGSASASTRVKIASVPPEYTPTAGPGFPEPVSMQSFYFEVEKETGRARVVVDYTYPDQPVFGLEGGLGPEPTMTQIPGLRYDPDAKTVVYRSATQTVVCATVRTRKLLFWKGLAAAPTGSCTVTSQLASHVEDSGWSIRHLRAIDTFFEVK